jgi:uncharacterized protein YjaG (DUF416 family)
VILEFNKTALRRNLDALSAPKQAAFMILLCERMMPGFRKFGADTGYEVSPYRECLDRCWTYIDHGLRGKEARAGCPRGDPDTEAFDHPLTSAALNAALAIQSLYDFLSSRDVDDVVEAAVLARDTVALYVQSVEAVAPFSVSAERITSHPLMQQELQRQVEDVAFLESLAEDMRPETTRLIEEHAARALGLIPLSD